MLDTAHPFNLAAFVQCTGDKVVATLTDRRPEGIALFGDLDDEQRVDLASEAWRIGLRALGNAHVAAQESRLKDVGTALVTEIDRQLHAHVEQQQEAIAGALARFFDPKDGQVSQRLAAFVDDQGVLARLLDKYVGPKNSVLVEAMARQIGESSPLFKKLSATDSEGLVKILERQLGHVMSESRSELMRALDPLAEDGAVARFLRSLREELKGAEHGRAEQLSAALAALDANNEASLLSRLVRETSQARLDVLEAMNPNALNSPMAVLTATVTRLLKEQASAETERTAAQEERQAAFEREVREALVRIETKRTHGQSSIRGGLDFEDSVIAFVRSATAASPCVLDVTGAMAGVGRCKKGDAVLRFTGESAFAGMAVVFEAKHDATFTVQKALDELDAARKNRDAVAGVFVMARSHASEAFPTFARYGSNVLVTWDDEDSTTDAYLHAAILLGMGLVVRSKPAGEAGDISALRDIESRVETELSRLERMEKHSDSIRKNVDGLDDEIRRARKAFDLLMRKAQSTLQALNVELRDESVERGSPIVAPAGFLTSNAVSPVSGEQGAA
jgi:hypothetical protein